MQNLFVTVLCAHCFKEQLLCALLQCHQANDYITCGLSALFSSSSFWNFVFIWTGTFQLQTVITGFQTFFICSLRYLCSISILEIGRGGCRQSRWFCPNSTTFLVQITSFVFVFLFFFVFVINNNKTEQRSSPPLIITSKRRRIYTKHKYCTIKWLTYSVHLAQMSEFFFFNSERKLHLLQDINLIRTFNWLAITL